MTGPDSPTRSGWQSPRRRCSTPFPFSSFFCVAALKRRAPTFLHSRIPTAARIQTGLTSALRTLQGAPQRTILGGDVQIWREPNTAITALEAYESVFAYRFKLYIEQHGFCGTGNLVVRKSDFENIGPFRGIEVAEDIEWGQRARAAGYTFRYVSGMIVFHPARQSLRELFVKWDRHIQHAVNAGSRNATWQARWVFRALAVLLSPVVDWSKVIASDRIHGVLPRVKAIFVLIAVRWYRAYKMVFLLMSRRQVQWNRDLTVPNSDVQNDVPRN